MIHPQMTITHGAVIMSWDCAACGKEWRVAAEEHEPFVERRTGLQDRRRVTRYDRRRTEMTDSETPHRLRCPKCGGPLRILRESPPMVHFKCDQCKIVGAYRSESEKPE